MARCLGEVEKHERLICFEECLICFPKNMLKSGGKRQALLENDRGQTTKHIPQVTKKTPTGLLPNHQKYTQPPKRLKNTSPKSHQHDKTETQYTKTPDHHQNHTQDHHKRIIIPPPNSHNNHKNINYLINTKITQTSENHHLTKSKNKQHIQLNVYLF